MLRGARLRGGFLLWHLDGSPLPWSPDIPLALAYWARTSLLEDLGGILHLASGHLGPLPHDMTVF